MTDLPIPPEPKSAAQKMYAWWRSLGLPEREACRRAGGKVENGVATKWERNTRVRAWIAYFQSLGQTPEMITAKRAVIEDRLNKAAFGDVFDFTTMVDRVVVVRLDKDTTEERTIRTPMINWDKVAESPYSVIISGFKFDKDTGYLTDFDRDNALQALAQLRDMHGFKAVTKTALTDSSGNNPASLYLISEKPMSEADWEKQRAGPA
jgi:hypothetical protein